MSTKVHQRCRNASESVCVGGRGGQLDNLTGKMEEGAIIVNGLTGKRGGDKQKSHLVSMNPVLTLFGFF